MQAIQNDPVIQRFKATTPSVYQNACRAMSWQGGFRAGSEAFQQLKAYAHQYLTNLQDNRPVLEGNHYYQSCGTGHQLPDPRLPDRIIEGQLAQLQAQNPSAWDRLHLGALWRKATTHPQMEALRVSDPQKYHLGLSTFLQGANYLTMLIERFPELSYADMFNESNLEAAFQQDMRQAIRQGRLLNRPQAIQRFVEQVGQELEGYTSRSTRQSVPAVSVARESTPEQIVEIDRLIRLVTFVSSKLKAPDGSSLDYFKVCKQALIQDRQYFDSDTAFLNHLQKKQKLFVFLMAELSCNQTLRTLLNRHPELAQTLLEESYDDAMCKSNNANDITEVMKEELARNLNRFRWNQLRRVQSTPTL